MDSTGGRPTSYTDEVANEIIDRIATGETLSAICREEGKPAKSTFFRWLYNDYNGLRNRYAKAFDERAVIMAYELLDIADDGTNDYVEQIGDDGQVTAYRVNGEAVARSRLRVDTRKWLLSKLIPKSYGDKSDEVHQVPITGITIEDA